MNRFLALCAMVSLMGGMTGVVNAAPKAAPVHKAAVKKTKIIDVWTCPITMGKVDPKMQAGKPQVVGDFRVHFCCPGCPSEFAKLSPKEKLAKAEAAYKKDKMTAKKTMAAKKK